MKKSLFLPLAILAIIGLYELVYYAGWIKRTYQCRLQDYESPKRETIQFTIDLPVSDTKKHRVGDTTATFAHTGGFFSRTVTVSLSYESMEQKMTEAQRKSLRENNTMDIRAASSGSYGFQINGLSCHTK